MLVCIGHRRNPLINFVFRGMFAHNFHFITFKYKRSRQEEKNSNWDNAIRHQKKRWSWNISGHYEFTSMRFRVWTHFSFFYSFRFGSYLCPTFLVSTLRRWTIFQRIYFALTNLCRLQAVVICQNGCLRYYTDERETAGKRVGNWSVLSSLCITITLFLDALSIP